MFVFLFLTSQRNTFELVLMRWMNPEPIRVSPFLNNVKKVFSNFSGSITFHVSFLNKQQEEFVHQNNKITLEREGCETREEGEIMQERCECKGNLRAEWRFSMRVISVQFNCSVMSNSLRPLDCSARELFS